MVIVFFKRFSANSDWPMTFFTSFYETSFITIPFLDFVFHYMSYPKSYSSLMFSFIQDKHILNVMLVLKSHQCLIMGFQFISCFLWSFFVFDNQSLRSIHRHHSSIHKVDQVLLFSRELIIACIYELFIFMKCLLN